MDIHLGDAVAGNEAARVGDAFAVFRDFNRFSCSAEGSGLAVFGSEIESTSEADWEPFALVRPAHGEVVPGACFGRQPDFEPSVLAVTDEQIMTVVAFNDADDRRCGIAWNDGQRCIGEWQRARAGVRARVTGRE